jgi:hypothetical protein
MPATRALQSGAWPPPTPESPGHAQRPVIRAGHALDHRTARQCSVMWRRRDRRATFAYLEFTHPLFEGIHEL